MGAQFVEHALQVGQNRGFEFQRLPGNGMADFQTSCVQGLAIENHYVVFTPLFDFALRDLSASAIESITQHRMTNVSQVDTDLVRAACLGKDV